MNLSSRRPALFLGALAALALSFPSTVSAASTPECLGRKATFVGTSGADTVTITRENTVAVLKGGNDTVLVTFPYGTAYICGGDGNDSVHSQTTGAVRFYGGAGKDRLLAQPRCPGFAYENRAMDVEDTSILPCFTS